MTAVDNPRSPDVVEVSVAPCSLAQQRMWLLERMERDSATYNVQLGVRFVGTLDRDALADTVTEVVRRHEALRTTFELDGDELLQLIAPVTPVPVRTEDLRGAADPERRLGERAAAELGVPFDLERDPPLRALLFRLADDEHVLVLVLDHIACDGTSVMLLHHELTTLYAAFSQGQPAPLPELAIQYADYAMWQRDLLASPAFDRQLDFWRHRLADPPERLALPVRSAAGAAAPRVHRGSLPPELTVALDSWARRDSASRPAALHGGLCALLARYTGADDIAVGTLLANRPRTELEPLVGFFVNTVVLRVDTSGDPTGSQLLRRARDAALDAHANQDVPFDRVVEELNPERTAGQPFFDVMFQYAEMRLPPRDTGEVVMRAYQPAAAPAPVPLVLNVVEDEAGVAAVWEYDAGLFDAETIAQLHRHYVRLLRELCAAPGRRLSELAMLDAGELARLAEWSGAGAAAPAGTPRTLHQVFAEQAARRPDAVAVVAGDHRLTYQDVDERSNRLAHWLRTRGVRADRIVGVCLPRGVDLLVAVLGISKAGGGYLPLDPGYPVPRLTGMVSDAAADLVLTHSSLAHRLGGATVVALDRLHPELSGLPACPVPDTTGLDDIAYVIYTSGSTGRPKGVALTHRGIGTVVAAQRELFGSTQDDRVLQFASPSFDASVFEMLTAWGAGAEIHVLTGGSGERAELARFVNEHRITIATLPPAALNPVGVAALPTLRVLNVAGEACLPAVVQRWAGGSTFHNLYGPTEATIWSTAYRARPADAGRRSVPIGRPIPGVVAKVLDRHGAPVPPGVWGQLHLGGDVLARCYLGQPALTADRFTPAEGGARLYRTGDLARWNADGQLEFGGRIDDQVKVRGHRVELGEVESVLSRHPAVVAAAALVRTDHGAGTLVGYVTATGRVDGRELRDWCARTLPDFMVPSSVAVLDTFPLTASGKVDRVRLLGLQDPAAAAPQGDHVEPDGELAQFLAKIWADVLDRDRISAGDNFFDLGGHSLLATLVITRLRAELDLEVPVRLLFDHPTLAGFAAALLAADLDVEP